MEVWKTINGYEGYYEVSNMGRVRSLDRRVKHSRGSDRIAKGNVMRQCMNRHRGGYYVVHLKRDGIQKTKYVHRLVCEAWHGPCPDGLEASHADDIREHNYPENLSWKTHAENIVLRGKNGGDTNGEKNGTSVLTEPCVHIILAMLAAGGMTHSRIADAFGVRRETISKISQGIRWNHLPRPFSK